MTPNGRTNLPATARVIAGTACMLLAGQFVTVAQDWPQWRGPYGNSTSTATNLPVAWSATSKIAWKTPLPGAGSSTPAVSGSAIFVTSQDEDELLLLRLDGRSGKIDWKQKVGSATTPRSGPKRAKQVFHRLHNLASPSPVTNGEVVVVHYGNGDLAAYDLDGKQLWKHNLQDEFGAYSIWWGHANSPVLYSDLVISVCMQDPLDDVSDKPAPSYLVAHNIWTGQVQWQSDRKTGAPAEQADAYTTPLLVDVEGHEELVVMGANQLDAYDPATGEQLWVMKGLVGGRTVTGPTAGDDLLYVTRGMRGTLMAVQLGGRGKRSDEDVVWKYSQGTPDTPCPVLWHETLFTVTDDGIARAFGALDGKLHWTQRLKGDYKASPLAAEGRVYFLNTEGLCTVVSAGDRFEKLAENQLSDTTLASPAVMGNKLLIRGHAALYCIGDNPIGDGK